MLGGDAVARAKVGGEGGVEVVLVKTGGSGVRDRFLKDASRGTCCAARWRARREVDCEGCGKKRSSWGGAGFVGKIAGVAKRVERRAEEYESN